MDQFVRNAVVGDDREAIFLEASPEIVGEGVGVGLGVLEADGRDVVGDRGHDALF